ncbi:MAG: hypothetical protein QXY20_08520, partial [Thermofilum sp.]
ETSTLNLYLSSGPNSEGKPWPTTMTLCSRKPQNGPARYIKKYNFCSVARIFHKDIEEYPEKLYAKPTSQRAYSTRTSHPQELSNSSKSNPT